MKAYVLSAATLLFAANAYAACPANTTSTGDQIEGKPGCALAAEYLNTTLALTADNSYVLAGETRIGGDNTNSSTLTLEPGTQVYGKEKAALVIMRGSKIQANGTSAKPVVFTSLQRSNLGPKLWGGIVINGNAPINACATAENPVSPATCEANSEGFLTNIPKFGGNKPADNSGRLKYVRVEYAGQEVAPGNELNGITFNGVGNGTEVDYVQVFQNADDGVEFFGGTVNVKHLVLIDNDDDAMDFDFGWSGKAQFILIRLGTMNTEETNGIEGSNFKAFMAASPRSAPIISNLTILAEGNPKTVNGIQLKEGAGGEYHNVLIKGKFEVAGFNIDHPETFSNAGRITASGVEQTSVKMVRSIVSAVGGNNFEEKTDDAFKISDWFKDEGRSNNAVVSPSLNGFLPLESEDGLAIGQAPSDKFFTPFDYVGAFSPYEDEDWTAGWTVK